MFVVGGEVQRCSQSAAPAAGSPSQLKSIYKRTFPTPKQIKMDSNDMTLRKLHRACYKALKEEVSAKVSTKILRKCATILPKSTLELKQICSHFRRTRSDVDEIVLICRSYYKQKEQYLTSGFTQDSQLLDPSDSEDSFDQQFSESSTDGEI